jgi:hypothetical protein
MFPVVGPLLWRRKKGVDTQLKNILDHCWNDAL